MPDFRKRGGAENPQEKIEGGGSPSRLRRLIVPSSRGREKIPTLGSLLKGKREHAPF